MEAAAQRGGYGNERYEKQEMQREVGLCNQLLMPHECSPAAEMPSAVRTGQAMLCSLITPVWGLYYADQVQVCKLYSVLQQQVPGWRMLDAARPVEELSQEVCHCPSASHQSYTLRLHWIPSPLTMGKCQ